MYHLFGFSTQNTLKPLYVMEELGVDFDFKYMDLFKGEQKDENFLKLNPVGKVPVLQFDGESLFESGAICRYVANEEKSSLYPEDPFKRAKVDQWMDFFSIHLGRWLSTLFFEKVLKEKADLGPVNVEKCAEAVKFAEQQMGIIDKILTENTYLSGDQLTIADLFAFAYIEQVKTCDFSLTPFPHVNAWMEKLDQRDSIKRARQRIGL